MKKIIFCIIIFLGFTGSYRLMRPGYLSMADDMHVFRLQQLDKCVHDGQIPCRYVPDGGMGYGYPLFNFYSPFPYMVGEAFHLAGFSYIDSIKIVFIVTSFIRPLGMFLLSSVFFGPTGGLVSAILYALGPYQAVNSYVRGAIAENFALAVLPFVFWGLFKKRYFFFSISIAILALTHNLTLLYSLPVIFVVIVLQKNNWRQLFFYFLLGIGISSFFVLPAFFEKQFTTVNTMTQDYFYYIIHFATLSQIFIAHNDWGYGASLWGPNDGMSFQIGYLQWIIPIISLFTAFVLKFKHKFTIAAVFFCGLFAIFLTHNKSTFIWQHVPLLPFYQFPWRFVGPATFFFSVISGFFITQKSFKSRAILIIFTLLIAEVILNINFFKEDIWFPNLTDQQKLSGANLIAQNGAGLKDYWPNYGKNFPDFYAPNNPIVTNDAKVTNYKKNSYQITADIEVVSDSSLITFPEVYFPKFEVKDNGQVISYFIDHDLGLINVYLPSGNHHITINFINTMLRFIANTISVVSIIILGLFYIYREK